jgi:RhoGEF domain
VADFGKRSFQSASVGPDGTGLVPGGAVLVAQVQAEAGGPRTVLLFVVSGCSVEPAKPVAPQQQPQPHEPDPPPKAMPKKKKSGLFGSLKRLVSGDAARRPRSETKDLPGSGSGAGAGAGAAAPTPPHILALRPGDDDGPSFFLGLQSESDFDRWSGELSRAAAYAGVLQSVAVVRIQSLLRGRAQRQKFVETRAAVATLQIAARAALARSIARRTRRERAAVVLQALSRFALARRSSSVQLRQQLAQRRRVLQELLETEVSFVKNMELLDELVVQRLLDRARSGKGEILPESVVSTLFSGFSKLVRGHRSFLDERLRPEIEQRGQWAEVGRMFVHFSNHLHRTHPRFISASAEAAKILREFAAGGGDDLLDGVEVDKSDAERRRKDLTAMLAAVNRDPRAQVRIPSFSRFSFLMLTPLPPYQLQDLESLVIQPVQRLPRYEMLLGDILKFTPEDCPDFRALAGYVGIESSCYYYFGFSVVC